ncbi:MAG: flagellar biosynthesis protein FlhA [bacterium]
MPEAMAAPIPKSNSDLFFAFAVVMAIIMVFIPLPPFLLSLLISFNIIMALVVVLITMYTLEPLHFSIFPTLLLITTLFRLALSISATRLILLHGNDGPDAAGQVIESIGKVVVGGSYWVGFVVFLILIIIQFVVITSGSQRVAEVAARFTLDAMPGKQMAIDADLNSGLITDDQARQRRKDVEREADFYGAMDGASKFVRGDAIAAIIIIIINVIGGFGVGFWSGDMTIQEVLKRYTLLSIGDGLSTQIPALFLSMATGIVVTRAASDSNLGTDLIRQITAQPKALWIAAGVLLVLCVLPGMPHLAFFFIAALTGWLAYTIEMSTRKEKAAIQKAEEQVGPEKKKEPENVSSLLQVDHLEIEIGYSLIPLVDEAQGGDLLERITGIRRQMATDLGLVVPPIRIRDNMQLPPSEYVIKIKGVEVSRWKVMTGHLLAMSTGPNMPKIKGIETKEPTFNLTSYWITDEEKAEAEQAGYSVVDASTVIATHLTEIVRNQAHEFLTRQSVAKLIEGVKKETPAVVDEIIPSQISIGDIQKILQNLLKERLPIRDLESILESVADHVRETKDPQLLTEFARRALSRSITKLYQAADGKVYCLTVDSKFEKTLMDSIQAAESGNAAALDPRLVQKMFRSLSQGIEKMASASRQPLVLCAPAVRPYFKKMVERYIPHLTVLSFNELLPRTEIQSLGVIEANEN